MANETGVDPHSITYNDTLTSVWSIEQFDDDLLSVVISQDPWVSQYLETIHSCPVVAATCRKFEHPPYFRLPGHRRAFYIAQKNRGGVIAVKGSEPGALDIKDQLEEFRQKRFSGSFHSMADYFVLREQKVPMALMQGEAMDEAGIALELHQAYYARYGELPRLPFPLKVLRWRESEVEDYVETLGAFLSDRAFEQVGMLVRDGLAVYYYYYPCTPIRVRDIHDGMQTYSHHGYADRMEEISRRMKPEQVMADWLRLVVRILGLGYLPINLSHDDVGQAVRAQNVVFDGGFADVGSFRKIDQVADELELCESLWVTLIELTMSVRGLMAGGLGINKIEHHDLSVVPFMVGCRIRDELLRILEREKRSGVAFNSRIESMLGSGSLFADLDRDLRIFYPVFR